MMNNKLFAFAAAILMVAVAGVVVDVSDDSDATATGSYMVYFYNGTSWSSKSAATYDLYQAIDSAKSTLNFDITADGSQTAGYNPNMNYGTISQVTYGGVTYSANDITTFVCSDTAGTWRIAEPALGWYRCFSDYAQYVTFPDSNWSAGASAGASNVAICIGSYQSIPAGASGMIGLTQVTQNDSDFEYVFNFKDQYGTAYSTSGTQMIYYDTNWNTWMTGNISTSMLQRSTGVDVKGYGSDVYLALKNAIKSSNLTAQEITWKLNNNGTPNDASDDYYTYYSWIGTMFNVTTIGPTYGSDAGGNYSLYVYWSFNTTNSWLSYSPGYYSQISGSLGGDEGSNFMYTYYLSKFYY